MRGDIEGIVRSRTQVTELSFISTKCGELRSRILQDSLISPFLRSETRTMQMSPSTRLWETNWWMNAIQWKWLTSIPFIITWGLRWTRVQELNGSYVVTWPTEVQSPRTILLSLAPWIATPYKSLPPRVMRRRSTYNNTILQSMQR
jgi:hypothetical protein